MKRIAGSIVWCTIWLFGLHTADEFQEMVTQLRYTIISMAFTELMLIFFQHAYWTVYVFVALVALIGAYTWFLYRQQMRRLAPSENLDIQESSSV